MEVNTIVSDKIAAIRRKLMYAENDYSKAFNFMYDHIEGQIRSNTTEIVDNQIEKEIKNIIKDDYEGS